MLCATRGPLPYWGQLASTQGWMLFSLATVREFQSQSWCKEGGRRRVQPISWISLGSLPKPVGTLLTQLLA